MRKVRTTILMIVLLSLSAIPFSFFMISGTGNTIEEFPDYQAVDWQSGLAGDVFMPELDPAYNPELAEQSGEGGLQAASAVEGDWVWDWYMSAISGGVYPYMQLRADVGNVQVWVAQDENLMFAPDDSRNDYIPNWQVTDEMCDYLASEFNDAIYQNCVDYFGAPLDRDGTNTLFEQLGWPEYRWNWTDTENPQKVILKIFNIRDEMYENPDYPYYVIGFYNSQYTGYYNRNMIHIDNWQWFDNLGPNGYSWWPDTVVEDEYSIETATAHEYQHNIHRDWQPHPESFMNEGCSMAAEFLCGYPYPWGYVPYFLATPDNSLVEWGDQGDDNILADYAHSMMFATYLADHFGAEFLTEYVQSGIPGIEGINTALATLGYADTFDGIFHDWRIANLIHTDSPGNGRYNYISIDLGEFLEGDFLSEIPRIYEVGGRTVPWTYGSDFGPTEVYAGLFILEDVINVGTYGTDYVTLTELQGINMLVFEGDEGATTPGWEMVDGMWYSGAQDLMNALITTEVYVDPADPFLYLTTYWDIEDSWDFGFVQVSTDGGEWDSTWTSLENEYTTDTIDPAAIIWAVENLPGLTSWSGFITEDGIVDMTFNLSAYAGETIDLGFRFVTDWATFYEGWYLIEGTVGSTEILSTLEHVYPQASWMVSVIERKTRSNGRITYIVHDMQMCGNWGIDLALVNHLEDVILVISPLMEMGVADYRFRTYHPCWKHR